MIVVFDIDKNCGIYKITSPAGNIYIGQSVNIKRRWTEYRSRKKPAQTIISRSFNKYGVENHQFDIIEYCSKEDLDCSERFWQDEFDVMGRNGLNCILTQCGEKRYEHSEETRKKMSVKMSGENNPMYGGNFSKKHIERMKGKRECITRGNHHLAKKVIDCITGEVWDCITDAAEANNIRKEVLGSFLKDPQKNNTNLRLYLICHNNK